MGVHTRKTIDLPQNVREFCDTHLPLIGATVTLEPEYGASLALQALQRLLHSHPNLGMIMLGIGPEEAKQFQEYAAVRQHVFFAGAVDANVSLSVMRRLSLFLRPTYFDGDSCPYERRLLWEFLSSQVIRPTAQGVVLFEPGKIDDLEKQLNYAIHHREQLMSSLQTESEIRGGIDRMMQIYQRLSNQ